MTSEFDAAVARGEALATVELRSYDPTVASVSTKSSAYHDVEYYKLCKLCHWPRNSTLCNCEVATMMDPRPPQPEPRQPDPEAPPKG